MTKACTQLMFSIKYMLNGTVYVIDTRISMWHKKTRNTDSKSYNMSVERFVDIDTQEDFFYT